MRSRCYGCGGISQNGLGEFLGGLPMSLLFSATYPDRVSHQVLVGGSAGADHYGAASQFEASVDKVVADWGSGQLMRRVVGMANSGREQLAVLGKYERMSCSPGAFKAMLVMNRLIDVTPILPNVRVP